MNVKHNLGARLVLFLTGILIICIILRMGFMQYSEIKERGYLVELQDHALEMEIRRNMNYYGDDIWSGQSKYWPDTIELIGKNIQNLEDLRHFPDIKRLYLRETSVTDLSPLESMKDLLVLIIDGGEVKDLEPLSRVTSLKYVGLKNLPVTSIQPLSELENISILSLSGLELEEIPSWEGDRLTNLELKNLPLTTIDGFRNEKNIEYIDIHNTKIEDVSILGSMLGLTRITITDSPIRHMPDLVHLSELYTVEIRNTNMVELPTLPNDLMELRLSGNLIYDFSFTEPMNALDTLEVSNIPEDCTLGELNFLKMCPKVSSLTLSNDRLQSLKGIETLSGLGWLYLSGNEINNLNGIEIHGDLRTLDMSDNPVNDLTGIEQLDDLEELNLSGIDLSGSRTQDIMSRLHLKTLSASNSSLENLNFLKNSLDMNELYISNNRLEDISVLAGLKGLSQLDISYNPITDLTPIKELLILNLNISGIDFKTIKPKYGEEVLKMKDIFTLTASNCNMENLDFINQWMFNIDVSDNHIQDLSILKNNSSYFVWLDVSGNPLAEGDLEHQLDVTEIYPGIYLGSSTGDLYYRQIKIDKDSELLEDIRHYKP